MQRKARSERTGRHALLGTGVALVLAASPIMALAGAGSASAAENSPQTRDAESAPQQICVIADVRTCYPTSSYSSHGGYWGGILKALNKVPGVSVSTTEDGWVVYILPYIEP